MFWWKLERRTWRKARQTREVVAAPCNERWRETSMSEPPEGVQSAKRRTRSGTRGVCSFETWTALITRPADQLLSATSMPVAVMTDRGKNPQVFALLRWSETCTYKPCGLWRQPVLNRQMDAQSWAGKAMLIGAASPPSRLWTRDADSAGCAQEIVCV